MNQKTVIQIWGKAGSGKTTTIKIIRQELERKYINTHHHYSLPLPGGELFEIITCNGLVIGISSMGDVLNDVLRIHLDNCFLRCDIIIAASRVYNDVDRYLHAKATNEGYRIIKATNYRIIAPRNIQDEFSQASAIHIVDLIDKIMKGTL